MWHRCYCWARKSRSRLLGESAVLSHSCKQKGPAWSQFFLSPSFFLTLDCLLVVCVWGPLFFSIFFFFSWLIAAKGRIIKDFRPLFYYIYNTACNLHTNPWQEWLAPLIFRGIEFLLLSNTGAIILWYHADKFEGSVAILVEILQLLLGGISGLRQDNELEL